jgi:hypothetical protein
MKNDRLMNHIMLVAMDSNTQNYPTNSFILTTTIGNMMWNYMVGCKHIIKKSITTSVAIILFYVFWVKNWNPNKKS